MGADRGQGIADRLRALQLVVLDPATKDASTDGRDVTAQVSDALEAAEALRGWVNEAMTAREEIWMPLRKVEAFDAAMLRLRAALGGE